MRADIQQKAAPICDVRGGPRLRSPFANTLFRTISENARTRPPRRLRIIPRARAPAPPPIARPMPAGDTGLAGLHVEMRTIVPLRCWLVRAEISNVTPNHISWRQAPLMQDAI